MNIRAAKPSGDDIRAVAELIRDEPNMKTARLRLLALATAADLQPRRMK